MTADRYQANIITKNPTDPSGPYQDSTAPGVWSMDEVLSFKKANKWPTAGSVETDPNFYRTNILISADGTEGEKNDNFLDRSNRTSVIDHGSNTAQGGFSPFSVRDEGWSVYFDGEDQYLRIDDALDNFTGSGDTFTIQFWIYMIGDQTGGSTIPIGINTSASGDNRLLYRLDSIWFDSYTTSTFTTPATEDDWTHVAISYDGSTLRCFHDGSQVYSVAGSFNGPLNECVFGVGAEFDGANGGSPGNYFEGYISNLKVTDTATTTGFTVPTSPLTSDANTEFLGLQSGNFRDNGPNNVSVSLYNEPQVRPYTPFAYTAAYSPEPPATGSIDFDGTDDLVTIPSSSNLQVGSSDFTLEMWFYLEADPSQYDVLALKGVNSANSREYGFEFDGSGGIYYLYSENGSAWNLPNAVSSSTLVKYQWYHLAVSRSGSELSVWLNGTRTYNDQSHPTSYHTGTGDFMIGAYEDSGTSYDSPAYFSDVRLVKGSTIYTPSQTTITVPTAPLTAVTNTQLLTCRGFYDRSDNNNILTVADGNPTTSAFDPTGTEGYYSTRFDGSTYARYDYNSSNLVVGTNEFTLELWVFKNRNNQSFNFSGAPTASGNYGFNFNSGTFYWGDGSSWSGPHSVGQSTDTEGKWTHYAFTRDSSGNVRSFKNGTLAQTTAGDTTNIANEYMRIAGQLADNNQRLDGNISNFRLIVGTCLYTANFTPSTTPLTAVTNTQLLTCQSNQHIDKSSNGLVPTVNATAKVMQMNPFEGTYDFTGDAGGIYFDGNNDFVQPNIEGPTSISDFKLTGWLYVNQDTISPSLYPRVFTCQSQDSTSGFLLYVREDSGVTKLRLYAQTGERISTDIEKFSWHYFELQRNNGIYTLTVNGVTNGTTWSNSDRLDFTYTLIGKQAGSNDGYFEGYMSDIKLTLDSSGASTSIPSAPAQPESGTALLLSGANAGVFDYTRKNTWTTAGNARVTTSQKKFGTGSIALTAAADYCTAPQSELFDFGTGDFTCEAWVYLNGNDSTYRTMLGFDVTGGLLFEVYQMKLDIGLRGTSNTGSTSTLTADQWNHLAITRSGGTAYWFINGTLDKTDTSLLNNVDLSNASAPLIGDYSAGQTNFDGYIDELRVTKGVARYTATFTPPTKAFPRL